MLHNNIQYYYHDTIEVCKTINHFYGITDFDNFCFGRASIWILPSERKVILHCHKSFAVFCCEAVQWNAEVIISQKIWQIYQTLVEFTLEILQENTAIHLFYYSMKYHTTIIATIKAKCSRRMQNVPSGIGRYISILWSSSLELSSVTLSNANGWRI